MADNDLLGGKRVLVGVTGGIAAYKSCELVRELRKLGAEVQVVMTQAAREFVSPLTFEALSERPVLTSLFQPETGSRATVHIDAVRWAQLVVISPATYDFVGKMAGGLADDVLSALVAAANVPIVLCPAMNKEMYANPAFQANLRTVRERGAIVVEPESGELACGEEGIGRLAAKERILDAVKRVLLGHDALKGARVLVTAGPTEEPLDPVRVLTNRSSGKMGYALAEAALWAGAEVTLISGPTRLRTPEGIERVDVRTSAEMAEAVHERWEQVDVLIMAAAVSDYRPRQVAGEKIKKRGDSGLVLELEQTEDILGWAGQHKGGRTLVGFAVETENELANGRAKLESKNLDLIVINNPRHEGAGFDVDTNRVLLLDREGRVDAWPILPKIEVARRLVARVAGLRRGH